MTVSKRSQLIDKRNQRHRDAAARAADGFVRTPADLADRIVSGHRDIGAFPRGARVLEPSAGDGALVRQILDADRDVHVTAVEPNSGRADAVDALDAEFPGRITVYRGTFEQYVDYVEWCRTTGAGSDRAGDGEPFDAVVMNPPFGDSQRADVWIDHVRAAWELLRPGSVLTAIVPPSYATREHRAHREFREWAQGHGATFEKLPAGSFAASGTGASAGVLTLPKPMPARPDGFPTWLYAPSTAAPVAVEGLPWTTAVGALTMPVQEYDDRFDGSRPRVIRYVGTCHGCGRTVWDHDGRGDASVWECNNSASADQVGKVGPTVCMCLECGTTGGLVAAALAAGEPYWTDAPADGEPAGPPVYPGDLGTGCWATVRGVDARGWDFTITGRVMRDPEPVSGERGVPDRRDRVAVALRTARGCDVELYAHAGERVTVHDTPADVTPRPYDGPRPHGLPETATGRTVGGYTEPAAVWTQPLSGDYGNMFATRHPVRVQPVTVVGDVPYEPGMVRVRTANGEVVRTLREYVTLDATPAPVAPTVPAGKPRTGPPKPAGPLVGKVAAGSNGGAVVGVTDGGQPVIVAHVSRFDLTEPTPAADEPADEPTSEPARVPHVSAWGEQLSLLDA